MKLGVLILAVALAISCRSTKGTNTKNSQSAEGGEQETPAGVGQKDQKSNQLTNSPHMTNQSVASGLQEIYSGTENIQVVHSKFSNDNFEGSIRDQVSGKTLNYKVSAKSDGDLSIYFSNGQNLELYNLKFQKEQKNLLFKQMGQTVLEISKENFGLLTSGNDQIYKILSDQSYKPQAYQHSNTFYQQEEAKLIYHLAKNLASQGIHGRMSRAARAVFVLHMSLAQKGLISSDLQIPSPLATASAAQTAADDVNKPFAAWSVQQFGRCGPASICFPWVCGSCDMVQGCSSHDWACHRSVYHNDYNAECLNLINVIVGGEEKCDAGVLYPHEFLSSEESHKSSCAHSWSSRPLIYHQIYFKGAGGYQRQVTFDNWGEYGAKPAFEVNQSDWKPYNQYYQGRTVFGITAFQMGKRTQVLELYYDSLVSRITGQGQEIDSSDAEVEERSLDSVFPGAGDPQSLDFYPLNEHEMLLAFWRGDQGWVKKIEIFKNRDGPVPIYLERISRDGWGDPIDLSEITENEKVGQGSIQAQDVYVLGDQILQTIWRGGEGFYRYDPQVDGVFDFNAGDCDKEESRVEGTRWCGTLYDSGLLGSGSITAQANFVPQSNEIYLRKMPLQRAGYRCGYNSDIGESYICPPGYQPEADFNNEECREKLDLVWCEDD